MTNYEKIMSDMNPEKFAQISIKPVLINNSEMCYMSTTGQLFPFANVKDALQYEYRWLTMEVPEEQGSVPAQE